jgi:hypothetical protein
MEVLNIINKEHDELRQGEAYAGAPEKGSFSKHFYIGYYYRHFC